MRRIVGFGLHLVWSLPLLVYFSLFRRQAYFVLTHHQDIDSEGLDRQMGPLLDEMRSQDLAWIEVCYIPIGNLFDNLRKKRRPCLSYAAFLAITFFLSWSRDSQRRKAAQDCVARRWLRFLQPQALFLIDESGSGQPFVRAARQLSIPTFGIQHGDFQPNNPQYSPQDNKTFKKDSVDCFCLWSSWFQKRLLQCSPIYDEANTLVTGRMRFAPTESTKADTKNKIVVLLLAEAEGDFVEIVQPYLEHLSHEEGIKVLIQEHPAERHRERFTFPVSSVDLATNLQTSDVILGRNSSALLEAIYWETPVILLESNQGRSCYRDEGIGESCSDPSKLGSLCRRVVQSTSQSEVKQRLDRIWAGQSPRAAAKILATAYQWKGGSGGAAPPDGISKP